MKQPQQAVCSEIHIYLPFVKTAVCLFNGRKVMWLIADIAKNRNGYVHVTEHTVANQAAHPVLAH